MRWIIVREGHEQTVTDSVYEAFDALMEHGAVILSDDQELTHEQA